MTTASVRNGRCSCCNTAITAFTADSSNEHTIQPCGCTVPKGFVGSASTATAEQGGEYR